MLHGLGGPLFFLWVLGAGALAVVFRAPLLAALLTLILGAAGVLVARAHLRDRHARLEMLRSVLAQRSPVADLRREPSRRGVSASRAVFLEIAARTCMSPQENGSSEELTRVLDTACAILDLQLSAARQAEDHQQVLSLVTSGTSDPGDANREILRQLAAEEERLVAEAGANLETILVHLLQLGRAPGALVGAAQAAEDADGTLHYLQARVEAQRETSETIRRSMRTRA